MLLALVWLCVLVHHNLANQNSDERYQLKTIRDRSARMYNNPNMSDIKFTYTDYRSGEEFYAHKYMLAIASPDFQEWFYGDTAIINTEVIDLPDISKDALAAFLAFVYKDECPKRIGIIFEVLRLTKEYKILSFGLACKSEFEKVFADMEEELLTEEYDNAEVLWSYIDQYADIFFASEYFLKINKPTLNALLARDTLFPDEKSIFDAVKKWADYQCQAELLEQTRKNRRKILGDAIYQIRFHTMSFIEFSGYSGYAFRELLNDGEILDLQNYINNGGSTKRLKWDTSMKKRKVINQLQSRLPSVVSISSVSYVEIVRRMVDLVFVTLGIILLYYIQPYVGGIVGITIFSLHALSIIELLYYPNAQLKLI